MTEVDVPLLILCAATVTAGFGLGLIFLRAVIR